MRPSLLGAVAGTLVLVLAGCGPDDTGSAGGSAGLTAVDLRLDWTWGAEHTGYLAAQELGYFRNEGLDVRITEGEGSAVTGTVVGTGESDFGVMAASEVMIAAAKGVSVQSIYTVLKSSPTAFIFNKDVLSVGKVTDLDGHRLGLTTQSAVYKEYEALADAKHLDRSKVDEVAVGAQIVPAMLANQVDAIVAFSTSQYPNLLNQGKNVGVKRFTDLGFPDTPSATVVVNNDFAKNNPKVVKAFVTAVKRGWQYVAAHPDEAVDLLKKKHPEVNADFAAKALPLALDLMGKPEQFGTFDETTWTNLKDLYSKQGVLKGDVALQGGVYDSEYLQ